MNKEIICITESLYRNALTRGKQYPVIATNEPKRQVRIQGDDGRTRWFPLYCFSKDQQNIASLEGYIINDPILPEQDQVIEVTVSLSDGQQRWCYFATPMALANCGDWVDGTQIPFHYCNRHVIIVAKLSESLIEQILKQIDSQGELIECTLALINDN